MCQRLKLMRPKILLLGAEGVGKTAFAVRYVTKRFIGEYDVSKETLYSHRCVLDKEEITIDIMDVSSDEEIVLENHVRWADGVIILYSIADRRSFTKLDFYHSVVQYYRRHHDDNEHAYSYNIPVLIVANKMDLCYTGKTISTEECDKLCRRLDCQKFEISVADSPDGVGEVVDYLLHSIKRDLQKAASGRRLPFPNVKRVFKRKVYRSKSDTLQ